MASISRISANGALKIALLCSAWLWPKTAVADPVDRWAFEIAEASARFSIPSSWIQRVMRAESGGQTSLYGRPVTSRAGAMGLMQLMPATWRDMRARLGLGSDPYDPSDNILAGTAYLRLMYDRFGYPGLFAAYNSGPARYAAFLGARRGLPAETRAYVALLASAARRPSAAGAPPPLGLFALTAKAPDLPSTDRFRGSPSGLFVALGAASQR